MFRPGQGIILSAKTAVFLIASIFKILKGSYQTFITCCWVVKHKAIK